MRLRTTSVKDFIASKLYARFFPLTKVHRIFPQKETERDAAYYRRCKILEWTTFEHLEIIPRNRCTEMWEYAADSIRLYLTLE